MSAWTRLRHAVDTRQGSTRPAALLRVGLALVVWTRFAPELALFQHGAAWDWTLCAAAVYLSSSLLLVGWRAERMAAVTALSLGGTVLWLGVLNKHREFVHHHISLLLIAVALLSLTGCGRSLSVDRWRALRAGHAPPERAPRWGMWLVALQVSAVYLWGAIDKLSVGFLSGERIQHHLAWHYFGSDVPTGVWFTLGCQALALATVALELALAVGLWFSAARRWLLPAGVLFHAGLYLTLPVATFTVTMFVLYLAFLDPAAVHRGLDRLLGDGQHPPP